MLKIIKVPKNLNIEINEKKFKISNNKEQISFKFLPIFKIVFKKEYLGLYFNFDYINDIYLLSNIKKNHNLYHTLKKLKTTVKKLSFLNTLKKQIEQAIFGLSVGFSKQLFLVGVGYKVYLENSSYIIFKLGFSHIMRVIIPKGIQVFCPKETQLIIQSSSNNLIGNFVKKYKI